MYSTTQQRGRRRKTERTEDREKGKEEVGRKTEKNTEGMKGVVERERKQRESGHLPALKWIKVS